MLRPDDFLSLEFEFVNLQLAKNPARLERADANAFAYVIAHFAPQNIGEGAFYQAAQPENTKPQKPDPDAAAGSETPSTPVRSRIAGRSRLVFQVPAGVKSIPYDMRNLLAICAQYDLSVAPTARPPFSVNRIILPGAIITAAFPVSSLTIGKPVGRAQPALDARASFSASRIAASQTAGLALAERRSALVRTQAAINATTLAKLPSTIIGAVPNIQEPSPTQTAIETPYRLMLSPNDYAAWAHSLAPVTSPAGRTELWHTRLGTRQGGQTVEAPNDLATLRAIWASDPEFDPKDAFNAPPHANSGQEVPFRLPLDASDRHNIVHLTADFQIPKYIPTPVDAELFMLSSMGAWMKTRGAWNPPANPKVPGTKIPVESWIQRGTMARDHYVRVVYQGHLFPFGHRATLVKVTERKFHNQLPGNPAYLRQRMYIVVREPERTFTHDFDNKSLVRQMPFPRVRITTLVTPDLDQPNPNQSLFWPSVSGAPFEFHLIAEGLDGKEVHFITPLLFADTSQPANTILPAFQQGDATWKRPDLHGQAVVFAPSTKAGDTSLDAASLTFDLTPITKQLDMDAVGPDGPFLYPAIRTASVSIPAVKHLGRNNQLSDISYHDKYLDGGFANTKGEVFAEVAGTNAKLDFSSHGDRSGGFVKPNLQVTALSRLLGPTGGSPSNITKGTFDTKDFFGALNAKIFGVFDLFKIIPVFNDLEQQLDRAPRFLTETAGFEAFLGDLDKLQKMADALSVAVPPGLSQALLDIPNAVAALVGDPFSSAKAQTLTTLLGTLGAGVTGLASGLPAGGTSNALKKICKDLATDLTDVAAFLKNLTSDEITVRLNWSPRISSWPAGNDPIFQANDPQHGMFLGVEIKAKKSNPAQASMTAICRLSDFQLNLVAPEGMIALHFDKIEFVIGTSHKPDVNVVLSKKDGGVEFIGCLAFVETLRSLIPLDGFSDPPALDVSEKGIDASYSMGLPNISVGVFSLQNLSLGAGFTVPFIGEPLSVRFNFCERHKPFLLTVWVFGGGGFFGITLDPGGVQLLEAAFEFGAAISVDLGVASGAVHVMAGIYFKMVKDAASLTGYFRMGGELSILGIVSMSLELYLELHYEFDTGKCVGAATLTVEVHVLCFGGSVEVHCERKFAGSNGDPTFEQIMAPEPPDNPVLFPWRQYCQAFA